MRLFEQLRHHARHQPDALAFEHATTGERAGPSLTYHALLNAVENVARAIARATPPDAVIMIQLPNALTYPVAFLGVLAAGRTVFPLHPALTPHEVAQAGTHAKAGWIISGTADHAGQSVISPDQIDDWAQRPPPTGLEEGGLEPDNAALLLQSSGTTGLPKIVERSARSIDAVAQNVAKSVGLSPADNVLAAIPLCHSYGIENAVVGPLWAGSMVRVCDRFDPETIAALWSRHPNAVFPSVPVMIDLLAGRDGLAKPAGNLRAIYAAGATLPAPVAKAFVQRYGVPAGQLYGATEIGSVTYGQAHANAQPTGDVGRPMAGVSVRILDLDHPTDRPPLAPGEQGQVAVRAPSMLDRYLGAGEPAMVDGHFLTGDLGRLDANGALSITGRVKMLIEVGGMKVNPMDVERVLLEHPGVLECAVVPVRITQTLSRVTAFIVATDPDAVPTVKDLRAHARQRLASFKLPRTFKIVASLPRTSLGKVQRQKLIGSTA